MGNSFQVQDRFADGAQYIGGRLRPGTSGRSHDVVNPATGKTVYTYELAGTADVDAAVAAARAAFPGWSGATPAERSEAMHRFAAVLAEQADDFAYAESLQCGKPVKLSTEFDVPGTVDNTSFFAGAARHLEGKSAAEYDGDHTSYVRREAIGVIGSIAPWNYPLQMAAWKVLPAIAAGNTIVLKPAEITPLTSLMFAQAATEAGIPDGVINIVTGSRQGRRRTPRRPPRRRDDLLHRIHRRRQAGRRDRHLHRQAAPPRTRRQGPLPGLRRRRPGGRGQRSGRRLPSSTPARTARRPPAPTSSARCTTPSCRGSPS